MLDPRGQSVEFDSRRRQTARADFALRTVAGLGDLPVIHMGDLVQEFPERPGFAQAVDEALTQLAACGVAPRFVPGNHDVGDKPDPTMPADWVTPAYLDDFHRRCGPSWQSWDVAGLHFITLNSQILNSGLAAAAEQAAWLEADLLAHTGQRIFLFLHLPPFLHNPTETSLGHYDNIDEPARSWLLGLVQRHQIETLFAAHIHWAFYNEIRTQPPHPDPPQIGEGTVSTPPLIWGRLGGGDHLQESRTSFYTVPSVAFTRPGFSELFASPPPPEQGRDDTGKLGFYLVRVMERGSRVHFVRTSGETSSPDPRPRLLTRTSPDLPTSPLGVVLHHPLSRQTETPSIWPSFVRQPVRNDYPLLAAQEVGVRHLLVTVSDLADPLQQERLGMLRWQGAAVTARLLWRPGRSLTGLLADSTADCDGVQVDITGSVVPDSSLANALAEWKAGVGLPITLSCVVSGRSVAGKQHNRAQVGFLPSDLAGLGGWLAQHSLSVERILCRMDMTGKAGTIAAQSSETELPGTVGGLDWIAELPPSSSVQRLNGAAEALFALAARPGSRLFIEPFIELDRTMDVAEGLLDRLCNPTPVFHLLRNLNTLLFSQSAPLTGISQKAIPGGHLLSGMHGEKALHLILPDGQAALSRAELGIGENREWSVYDLASGRRIEKELPGFGKPDSSFVLTGPTLLA